MTIEQLCSQLGGQIVAVGEAGFAAAREGLVWNDRKPETTPRVIVKARSTADVQAAVRYAAANGLRVSARSGGHNWSGVALQDGVAIDLGALDRIRIDRFGRMAEVGPAARNLDLAKALTAEGLAFPVGHCGDVAMGGYLLGGGFGWNEGTWGLACHLIDRAEVVLADGRIVTVSETEHADIFWALRGAGPLFFGIVTRYWLRLMPLPPAMAVATWTYPLARVADVTAAMKRLADRLPAFAELSVSLAAAPPAAGLGDARFATLVLTVYGGSMTEVAAVAANAGHLLPDAAVAATPLTQFDFATLYGIVDQSFPDGARYGVDCLWGEDADATLDGLARMVAQAPSLRSNAIGVIYGQNSHLRRGLADAALSVVGSVCGIVHGTWADAAEDAANLAWLRNGMDALDPVTTGRYVGHADLAREGRIKDCFSAAARTRIATLAATYDPKGVFAGRRMCDADATPMIAVAAA
ncbi:MAG: FAD-binding oxidoreductase [Tabrizicola sp.]|uniref:FAD-binding oxidoreductase n=1 Tax=Tabrizicola sp. TaxID=2005166 RepID=UPI002733A508|nr:FAD-binding oxidoreductase [Tabrizicola sp.]MDP3265054.1 FAD-binding oxidoreductase [Tabrizicola sp.]MDP3647403.1 FAD-binding oxidoreductase [Paracoccaceae bacterium]MDZ4066393.1 FAD-binding oxidoreductase [Tabrizicola sp.]